MKSTLLRVIPKTYKLFLDKKTLKTIDPYLNVSSGSYSNMSKVVRYDGENPNVQMKQEAKNHVFVELRDSETGTLLGKNRIEYDSLPEQNATFEERVPLRNNEGEEIGEAILEVQVTPRKFRSLGFWEEQPKLESEKTQEKLSENKQAEESRTNQSQAAKEAKKEEPTLKQEASKKEEAPKKEEASQAKKTKAQEIKPEQAVEYEDPFHHDIFYDFERTRREMDRIFYNFERVFGDRVFSGFSDEFRRAMRTFDQIERSMFRDFDDFMLPFRTHRRWYLEDGRPNRRNPEAIKSEKTQKEANPKPEAKVNEKEQQSSE